VSQFSRELRLKKAIEPLKQDAFDFVFLDCPPSLGLLTVNALAAAEELIVPIQCEYYALEGLGQLLRNVRLVQQNVNTDLRLTGIVMTMFDPRTKLSEQVVAEVRRYFGDRVYRTIIPRTVRLSEAPGFGQPITVYDPHSKGAESYRDLAQEVAVPPPGREPAPERRRRPERRDPPPEAQPGKAPRPLVGPEDGSPRPPGRVPEDGAGGAADEDAAADDAPHPDSEAPPPTRPATPGDRSSGDVSRLTPRASAGPARAASLRRAGDEATGASSVEPPEP
jgi:chromosome partitioning protein